jgi:hypothetical protein
MRVLVRFKNSCRYSTYSSTPPCSICHRRIVPTVLGQSDPRPPLLLLVHFPEPVEQYHALLNPRNDECSRIIGIIRSSIDTLPQKPSEKHRTFAFNKTFHRMFQGFWNIQTLEIRSSIRHIVPESLEHWQRVVTLKTR